jgi:hypothetical protein
MLKRYATVRRMKGNIAVHFSLCKRKIKLNKKLYEIRKHMMSFFKTVSNFNR